MTVCDAGSPRPVVLIHGAAAPGFVDEGGSRTTTASSRLLIDVPDHVAPIIPDRILG